MSGPPPKDPSARRRRNATPGFKLLPHEGRTGPSPDWPLSKPSSAERQFWDELWTMPQAIEWERMRCHRDVARYVRYAIVADSEPDPKMSTEVRQLDAKIGVSPKAMRDLRWETDEAIPGEDPEPEPEVESIPDVTPTPRAFVPETH